MLAGRLVKTLAITGVSGHAILPAIKPSLRPTAYIIHAPGGLSEAVTAGAVTELSITGTHAVCSPDPTVTQQPMVHFSSAVEAGPQLGVDGIHRGSKIPPTPTTANATHISSCLSTSAHCCIKDSQGNFINLFVLFHRAT